MLEAVEAVLLRSPAMELSLKKGRTCVVVKIFWKLLPRVVSALPAEPKAPAARPCRKHAETSLQRRIPAVHELRAKAVFFSLEKNLGK